jgi:hypothetical protein
MNLDFLIELSEGDPVKLARIVNSGINTFQEFITNFKVSVKERNLAKARDSSHKIKSVASVIEIKELLENVTEIKRLLDASPKSEEIDPLMDKVENETYTIIERLKGIL